MAACAPGPNKVPLVLEHSGQGIEGCEGGYRRNHESCHLECHMELAGRFVVTEGEQGEGAVGGVDYRIATLQEADEPEN